MLLAVSRVSSYDDVGVDVVCVCLVFSFLERVKNRWRDWIDLIERKESPSIDRDSGIVVDCNNKELLVEGESKRGTTRWLFVWWKRKKEEEED